MFCILFVGVVRIGGRDGKLAGAVECAKSAKFCGVQEREGSIVAGVGLLRAALPQIVHETCRV